MRLIKAFLFSFLVLIIASCGNEPKEVKSNHVPKKEVPEKKVEIVNAPKLEEPKTPIEILEIPEPVVEEPKKEVEPIEEPKVETEPEVIEEKAPEPQQEVEVEEEVEAVDCSTTIQSCKVGDTWINGKDLVYVEVGNYLTIGLESGNYTVVTPWKAEKKGAFQLGRAQSNYGGRYVLKNDNGCETYIDVVMQKTVTERPKIDLKDESDVDLTMEEFIDKYDLQKPNEIILQIKVNGKKLRQ